MVELTLLLLAAILLGGMVLQRRRRRSVVERARSGGEVSARDVRLVLGQGVVATETAFFQVLADELPGIRRTSAQKLNELATRRLKVLSVRGGKRGRSSVELEEGWLVEFHDDQHASWWISGQLRKGPVHLEGAQLSGSQVVIQFRGERMVNVPSGLVQVRRG